MIRRPPRSTQSRSSAASDVYKRQGHDVAEIAGRVAAVGDLEDHAQRDGPLDGEVNKLSLIHISEPTRPY